MPKMLTDTQSIRTEGTQVLIFEQLYSHMEILEGLSLVPVYSQSGEHLDEPFASNKS